MKLSNVVVMCLSALLGLLMVCFTAIAFTMVVNWSAPEEAAILEGKVCSVQVFNSDYEVQPLVDGVDDMPYPVEGEPDDSILMGAWFLGSPSGMPFPTSCAITSFDCSFPLADVDFVPCMLSFSGQWGESFLFFVSCDGGPRLNVYSSYDGWVEPDYRVVVFNSSSSVSACDSLAFCLSPSNGAYKISDDINWKPPVPISVQPVTEVFDGLGVWLIAGLNNVIALFWVADTGTLTLLGVLAVCGLAVSVFLLIVGIIQNFLHFRG